MATWPGSISSSLALVEWDAGGGGSAGRVGTHATLTRNGPLGRLSAIWCSHCVSATTDSGPCLDHDERRLEQGEVDDHDEGERRCPRRFGGSRPMTDIRPGDLIPLRELIDDLP